jgi:cell wall-associated NlpC family hydrolase
VDQPTSLGAARLGGKTAALALAVTGTLAAGMVTAAPEAGVAEPVAISGPAGPGSDGWTGIDGYPWRSTLTLTSGPATANWSHYTTMAERAEWATTLGATTASASRLAGKLAATRNAQLVASRSAPVGSRSAPVGSRSVPVSGIGARVVAAAARLEGSPYRYGAAGPSAFDCSGFTLYVFRQFGVYLPHKADSQRHYGRAVSRAEARPGDLIVFLSGGYGYHAGIYAGGGYMWDSPHTGGYVGLHKIWSTNIVFRRLV